MSDEPEERIINRRHFGNLLTATHIDHIWKEEEVNDIWKGLKPAPPEDWKDWYDAGKYADSRGLNLLDLSGFVEWRKNNDL